MSLDPVTAALDFGGKSCSTCKQSKLAEEFSIDRSKRSGRHGRCKECVKAFHKAKRATQGEAIREADRQRYAKTREERRRRQAHYYATNKETVLRQMSEYRAANRERIQAYLREYGQRHKIDLRPLKALWASARRARTLDRIPAWADRDAIKAIYLECARMNNQAGTTAFHVDHILPLAGRRVSGLHVAENLQILSASENLRKSNNYGGEYGH